MHRRDSRPRAAARCTGARRDTSRPSSSVPAGCSIPSSSQTSSWRPAERDRRAETGHERERGHAAGLRDARPHVGLVDERLADVEDDYADSHAATRSRSARVVTLSSRSSPGTTLMRPPFASTSDAQSVAFAGCCSRAQRGRSARRDERLRRLHGDELVARRASRARRRRARASPCRRRAGPGTAPSKPSPSASSTRCDHVVREQRPRRVVDEDHRRRRRAPPRRRRARTRCASRRR